MNDNDPFAYHEEQKPLDRGLAQDQHLARCGPLAERAITDAGTLSVDEIRDIGWGLFVALRRLKEYEAGVVWDAGKNTLPK